MIEVKLVKVTFEDVKDLDLFEDVTAEQFQEFMRKTGSYGKTYKRAAIFLCQKMKCALLA